MSKKFSFALFLLLFACTARSQDELEHLSPFAHGAGRTYALTSRGLDAIGLNPSLLAFGTPRPLEITIAPISSLGIYQGSSLSQINSVSKGFDSIASVYIPDTATGLTTGDSIRESIAKLLANNGLSSTIDARVLGVSYYNPDAGGFAFTWTMHAILRASIPQGLLDYIGVGAVSKLAQGAALPPQNLDIQALWYSEYTLTYARTLFGDPMSGNLQLLGGAGVKYLSGIATLQMNPGEFDINDPDRYPNSGFSLNQQYIVGVNYQIHSAYPSEFNFTSLPSTISAKLIANATAGNGIGADIGFTIGAFDSLQRAPFQFALSVSDIGSIHWNSNVSVRTADTVLNPKTTQSSKDTLNNQLKALGGVIDTAASSYSTPLPTTLHIAAGIDLSEIGISLPGLDMGAVAEYALGLTNTAGAPANGRLGFAATLEHPSSSFSFHAALGFTTQDGASDLTAAFGFGIGNRILLDLGTDGLTGLFSSSGHTDAVFGLKVLF